MAMQIPLWRHRNDSTVETSVDTPPGGRDPSPEELKLIQAMTVQERQEIDAICERARQRLSQPEVQATTQAGGHDAEIERLKTPTALLGCLPAATASLPRTSSLLRRGAPG
jgi:hypothetical protein